jgi:hypothetical protein
MIAASPPPLCAWGPFPVINSLPPRVPALGLVPGANVSYIFPNVLEKLA